MNPRLARALVRLYPRAWRERYGVEFGALLEDGPGGVREVLDVMGSALGERALPTIGGDKMSSSSRMKTWSLRAPWAVFVIAPLGLFAASYGFALFILWSGWRMFLPNEEIPFVVVHGWAAAYFGLGRALYFSAPFLLGLAIAWMAAWTRIKAIWPAMGMTLIALLGGLAQVRVSRVSLSEPGHVGMGLTLWHPAFSAAVLLISVLAFWLLRMRREQSPMV